MTPNWEWIRFNEFHPLAVNRFQSLYRRQHIMLNISLFYFVALEAIFKQKCIAWCAIDCTRSVRSFFRSFALVFHSKGNGRKGKQRFIIIKKCNHMQMHVLCRKHVSPLTQSINGIQKIKNWITTEKCHIHANTLRYLSLIQFHHQRIDIWQCIY